MKYAKIKNGKVVDIINGLAPSDYVEVIQKWVAPTEYPLSFYVTTSNEPIALVVGDEVHDNWGFILKPIENIKTEIYDKQKSIRKTKQLGTFDFGGVPILLNDNEDSLLIQSLDNAPLRFKIAGGRERVALTAEQVVLFKQAHRDHVQAAYDWEEGQNILVEDLGTHQELNDYLTTLEA